MWSVTSVYSGSKNEAYTTSFCWHNCADQVIKNSKPWLAELWQQKQLEWRQLTLENWHFFFFSCNKCGLFSSGEQDEGNTTTVGDGARFCFCSCSGNIHELWWLHKVQNNWRQWGCTDVVLSWAEFNLWSLYSCWGIRGRNVVNCQITCWAWKATIMSVSCNHLDFRM